MLNVTLPTPARFHAHLRPTGAKIALKPVHVWGIRGRLQVGRQVRELALFALALDSKLRGCDLTARRVLDLVCGGCVKGRAIILQRKAGRPVQFEVTEQTPPVDQQLDRGKAAWARRLALPQPQQEGLSSKHQANLPGLWTGG